MKKNYQIPLCKGCWDINYHYQVSECYYFDLIPKPYTEETARTGKPGKEPLIDYEKNTCRFFKSTESMKDQGFGLTAKDRHDQNVANRKWLRIGNYYGQS